MGLEDVINAYERLGIIGSVVATLKKDPYNNQAFNNFLEYAQKYEGIDAMGLQAMAQELQNNPRQLRALSESRHSEDQKVATKSAADNCGDLVASLSDDNLKLTALNIPNKDVKYLDVAKKLQAGDFGAAREAYAKIYDSKLWKEFVNGASKNFVQQFMQTYIAYNQDLFLKEKLSKKVEKDGKESFEFDKGLTQGYIVKTVGAIKDEAERNGAYNFIATRAYAQKKGIKLDNHPGARESEEEDYELDLAA